MEPMKEEMNEMRVRTEQMQNHAMEQMQEAKDIKMKKFLDEAMIKKTVGSVFTVVAFVGVPLGIRFGLFLTNTQLIQLFKPGRAIIYKFEVSLI